MADLDSAAKEALDRVRLFLADVQTADEVLDAAARAAEELQQEVSTTFGELTAASEALAQRLTDEAGGIASEADATQARIGEVVVEIASRGEAVNFARVGFSDQLQASAKAVAGLEQEQGQALDALEAALQALRERSAALEATVRETAAEVDAFLGPELEAHFDDIQARLAEARARIATAVEETTSEIEAHGEEFAASLESLRAEIDAAYDEGTALVRTDVLDASEVYLLAQKDVLEDVGTRVGKVVDTLAHIEQMIETRGLTEPVELATKQAELTHEGLLMMAGGYRSAAEHLARYGIEGAEGVVSSLP